MVGRESHAGASSGPGRGTVVVGRVEGPLSLWLGVAKGTFKRVGALGGGLASGRFHCLARYDICSPVQTPWRMGRRETRAGGNPHCRNPEILSDRLVRRGAGGTSVVHEALRITTRRRSFET